MKGGVLKEINEQEFTSWKNPHNFPNDCCPCVFNFLGMPFSEAEKHALANPEGFRKYEIEIFCKPSGIKLPASRLRQIIDREIQKKPGFFDKYKHEPLIGLALRNSYIEDFPCR